MAFCVWGSFEGLLPYNDFRRSVGRDCLVVRKSQYWEMRAGNLKVDHTKKKNLWRETGDAGFGLGCAGVNVGKAIWWGEQKVNAGNFREWEVPLD